MGFPSDFVTTVVLGGGPCFSGDCIFLIISAALEPTPEEVVDSFALPFGVEA